MEEVFPNGQEASQSITNLFECHKYKIGRITNCKMHSLHAWQIYIKKREKLYKRMGCSTEDV